MFFKILKNIKKFTKSIDVLTTRYRIDNVQRDDYLIKGDLHTWETEQSLLH